MWATRRRRILLTLVALAGVLTAATFGLAGVHSSASGSLAPALPRETLLGGRVSTASLLAGARGRATAIVFWASWCEPCAREAPALERFASGAVGRGRIVGVDWSDALSGARAFMRRYGWTFPNLRDAEGTVGYAYHISGLPTTFVLDPQGRIAEVLRGPQTESSLAQALAHAGPS